jgi:hypothetical protein
MFDNPLLKLKAQRLLKEAYEKQMAHKKSKKKQKKHKRSRSSDSSADESGHARKVGN